MQRSQETNVQTKKVDKMTDKKKKKIMWVTMTPRSSDMPYEGEIPRKLALEIITEILDKGGIVTCSNNLAVGQFFIKSK